mmetsp:Transcript_41034/g.112968  ORF Transcript_41034/g.112968 Transcript_41034/m.112968 type:complete len:200 (+) Transcript_41034:1548-2147(+)
MACDEEEDRVGAYDTQTPGQRRGRGVAAACGQRHKGARAAIGSSCRENSRRGHARARLQVAHWTPCTAGAANRWTTVRPHWCAKAAASRWAIVRARWCAKIATSRRASVRAHGCAQISGDPRGPCRRHCCACVQASHGLAIAATRPLRAGAATLLATGCSSIRSPPTLSPAVCLLVEQSDGPALCMPRRPHADIPTACV